ncbi:MAG: ribosome recycling factor, partial [Actinobacteria bacterium]|nr:ribosome recycling factor [Actinomycetota bacterium]
RKEMVKLTKTMAEDGRVAIRNLRRSSRHDLEALEKDGEISADELERAEKDLDKITASYVSAVDAALEQKERELLEV